MTPHPSRLTRCAPKARSPLPQGARGRGGKCSAILHSLSFEAGILACAGTNGIGHDSSFPQADRSGLAVRPSFGPLIPRGWRALDECHARYAMGRSAERPPRDLCSGPPGLAEAGLAHGPPSTATVPVTRFQDRSHQWLTPAAFSAAPFQGVGARRHKCQAPPQAVFRAPDLAACEPARTDTAPPPHAARRLVSAPLRGQGCEPI